MSAEAERKRTLKERGAKTVWRQEKGMGRRRGGGSAGWAEGLLKTQHDMEHEQLEVEFIPEIIGL